MKLRVFLTCENWFIYLKWCPLANYGMLRRYWRKGDTVMRHNPDWIRWTNRIMQLFCGLIIVAIVVAWFMGQPVTN